MQNTEANALAAILRAATLIAMDGDEAPVSTETGMRNIERIQQAANDLYGQVGDEGATADALIEIAGLCEALLALYEEHGTDPDGDATVALYNALPAVIGPIWQI